MHGPTGCLDVVRRQRKVSRSLKVQQETFDIQSKNFPWDHTSPGASKGYLQQSIAKRWTGHHTNYVYLLYGMCGMPDLEGR